VDEEGDDTKSVREILAIDIKLHPAVLPLLSPLGGSLSLGVIEVLVEKLMTRWWIGIVLFNNEELPLQYS